MSRFTPRHRDYLIAGVLMLTGVLILYFPGGLGGEDSDNLFVTLGATLMVGGLGWGFLRLDRQVSDNPRYRQREVYLEEQERERPPDDQD